MGILIGTPKKTPRKGEISRCLLIVRRIGMTKPPVKLGVGKKFLEKRKEPPVEIIEAECCPDHIHMLVTIPPHLSITSFMGYLKRKSSLMIFDKHANLKYKYANRHFWCRGYYVDTVG